MHVMYDTVCLYEFIAAAVAGWWFKNFVTFSFLGCWYFLMSLHSPLFFCLFTHIHIKTLAHTYVHTYFVKMLHFVYDLLYSRFVIVIRPLLKRWRRTKKNEHKKFSSFQFVSVCFVCLSAAATTTNTVIKYLQHHYHSPKLITYWMCFNDVHVITVIFMNSCGNIHILRQKTKNRNC